MSSSPDPLGQARVFLEVNRPKETLRIVSARLAENPDDAAALLLLAQAHLAAASGAEGGSNALPAAQHVIELDPNDSHAWRLLSLCYTRLGWHRQAREAARAARNLSPDQWVSHTVVAHADASGGAVTDDTRASIAEAMRLGPNHPEVHFAAGHVAQASRQFAAAKEHYERTLAINPDHTGARNNLALIELRRGNAGQAAAGFAGLLAQNPNSQLALRNLRATGFSALRIVYLILIVCVLLMANVAGGTATSADPDEQFAGIIVAVLAIGSVTGYVLWFRHRAGIYFGRFVRSVPSTDRLLLVWAVVLAVCLAAIAGAVFAPGRIASAVYDATEALLVSTVLIVSLINSARRRT
jgi:Flp pilus assembly protein TadD